MSLDPRDMRLSEADDLRRKAKDMLARADKLDAMQEPSNEDGAVIRFQVHYRTSSVTHVAIRYKGRWKSTAGYETKYVMWHTLVSWYPDLAKNKYDIVTGWEIHDAAS